MQLNTIGVKMKKLILLMAVLFAGVAMAQETVIERKDDGWIVIKDGNGTLRSAYSPTPQMALEAIRTDDQNTGKFDAAMILKQKVETRSDAELNAFADELVRLVMETPSRNVANKALYALGSHKRGLEILIDIYENLNGTEAVSKGSVLFYLAGFNNRRAFETLVNIYENLNGADTVGVVGAIFRVPGGKDYLMNLYASLERPEEPCKIRPDIILMKDGKRIGPPVPPEEKICPYKTQWCQVATMLSRQVIRGKKIDGVDPAYVFPLCDRSMIYLNGRWWKIAGH